MTGTVIIHELPTTIECGCGESIPINDPNTIYQCVCGLIYKAYISVTCLDPRPVEYP